MPQKQEVIRGQNRLNIWISEAHNNFKLSREQIRYILADKLRDMSLTDMFIGDNENESP